MAFSLTDLVSKLEALVPKVEAALPTAADDITKVEDVLAEVEAFLPANLKADAVVVAAWLAGAEKVVTVLESVLAKL